MARRLLAEGKAQFVDWEEAKQQINKATQSSFRSSTWPGTT